MRAFACRVPCALLLLATCGRAAPETPRLISLANELRLGLTVGRTTVVMGNGGNQPYLFCSSQGTLFCEAQINEPPFGTRKMVYHVRIGAAVSRDRGATWTPWTGSAGRDIVFIEGGAVQCADGPIVMLDTYVPLDGSNQGTGEVWKSTDDLRTLNGPFLAPFHLPRMPVRAESNDMGAAQPPNLRLHRSILELPGGDLLATGYVHFATDTAPSAYMPSMMKSRVIVVRSRDRGASWTYLATVGVDGAVGTEGYNEPALVRLAHGRHAGRLICLIRTGRDLYRSYSDDNGASWVRPTPTHFPGVNIYDTARRERLFRDPAQPEAAPTDEMIGAIVDPDLIEMADGLLVCAFGARMPARKAAEGLGRPFIKGPDGRYPDGKPKPGQRYDTWRAPENGDYLAFSADAADTWGTVVQFRSALPTTHYIGVREVAPNLLYVVYDNSLPRERQPADASHEALGFQLSVSSTP